MPGAPILDPHSVPVIGTDAYLPPVPAQHLTAEALRQRFASPPVWQPEFPGDLRRFHDRIPAAASVLVPLVDRGEGLNLLLTRRTEHLRDHAGQISFPGGRSEASDTDAVDTALREAEEEIGLSRRHVDVIGTLPVYTTITAFQVTPVVALLRPPFSVAPDPSEVAEAFEVPLSFLMTPAYHQRHDVEVQGVRRQFLSIPWTAAGPDGTPQLYFIWGATASMLRNFYRFLSA